jgi:hypothetical protein
MKQLCSSYSISGNAITLTGVNLPQDHILLISNATSGGVLYSLSSGTAASYTQGANSVLTLSGSPIISNTDDLVIYYDDGVASSNAPSSVSVSNFPSTQPVRSVNPSTGFNVGEFDTKTFTYSGENISSVVYSKLGSAIRTLTYNYSDGKLTSIASS